MSNDNDLPQSRTNSAAGGASGPSIAFIALLVVVALAVVFFLQNGEYVSIDFLVFEKRTTLRWSILMAVVLGVLLDRVFTIAWRRHKKTKRNS
ncbi:MAG TPA: hypothetical protein PK020_10135 [Ilumatobacteraceae bacterium]|nr:hypothetical protein [Ilumatobacteraceae bacterium]